MRGVATVTRDRHEPSTRGALFPVARCWPAACAGRRVRSAICLCLLAACATPAADAPAVEGPSFDDLRALDIRVSTCEREVRMLRDERDAALSGRDLASTRATPQAVAPGATALDECIQVLLELSQRSYANQLADAEAEVALHERALAAGEQACSAVRDERDALVAQPAEWAPIPEHQATLEENARLCDERMESARVAREQLRERVERERAEVARTEALLARPAGPEDECWRPDAERDRDHRRAALSGHEEDLAADVAATLAPLCRDAHAELDAYVAAHREGAAD
jgi:hypothetical protein